MARRKLSQSVGMARRQAAPDRARIHPTDGTGPVASTPAMSRRLPRVE